MSSSTGAETPDPRELLDAAEEAYFEAYGVAYIFAVTPEPIAQRAGLLAVIKLALASQAGAEPPLVLRTPAEARAMGAQAGAEPLRPRQPLPHPGSPEASAMLDSLLAEYQWPANPKNAARAGWEAAQRWLKGAALAEPQAEPRNPDSATDGSRP